MPNTEGDGDGIKWFTVAHGALALLSVLVAYMGKIVVDNSNRLAAIETGSADQSARIDRQVRDLMARIDHDQAEVTHMNDKLDDRYKRVEDRLEAQILLLQRAASESERRAIEECRSIVSTTARCALPPRDKP